VKYHSFDVVAVCKPAGIREVLKAVTAPNAPQFYVLRNIRIHNQADKGPPRAGDPNKPEKDKEAVSYIVGQEWIEVSARFDIVDFANPSEKAAPETSASSTPPTSTPARK